MKHKLYLLMIISTCLISLSTLVAADPSPNPGRPAQAPSSMSRGHAGLIGNGGDGGHSATQADQIPQNGGNAGLLIGNGGSGGNGASQAEQTPKNVISPD